MDPFKGIAPSAMRSMIGQWIRKAQLLSEINGLDASTRGQLMNELNVSEADLNSMANLSLNAEGLERVLALMGIDEAELARTDPSLMADLRRSCSMCKDWKDCARALDAGAFSPDVEDYCLNRDTIRGLANGVRE